jgi:hypothetical protein
MAGGVITTGAHPKALWPGVYAWFGASYNKFPEEWKDIFDIHMSEKNFEEDVQSKGFGLATVKNEGKAVDYTSHAQGWVKRYVHVVYGLGFIITREEKEDNLYKELATKRAGSLAFSMRTTKEIIHANHINRMTNASYTGGDGQPLLSTSHPTDAGNQSNYLTPAADLSEAALEDLLIMVMTVKDEKGLQIPLIGMSLHIHPNDWFEANRILKSSLQNDTANNAINALKITNAIPNGIKMNHYFTDTDAWGVKTNCPDGFKHFVRRSREFTQDNDFSTENALAKATERYSSGWTDWRCFYGSPGA